MTFGFKSSKDKRKIREIPVSFKYLFTIGDKVTIIPVESVGRVTGVRTMAGNTVEAFVEYWAAGKQCSAWVREEELSLCD